MINSKTKTIRMNKSKMVKWFQSISLHLFYSSLVSDYHNVSHKKKIEKKNNRGAGMLREKKGGRWERGRWGYVGNVRSRALLGLFT